MLFWTLDFEREKFHGLFGPLEYQKNKKNSKTFWKNQIQENCTKKYNFAPDAANHTFFTHPDKNYVKKREKWIKLKKIEEKI